MIESRHPQEGARTGSPTPTVAVIIPAHNAGRYVGRAIDSVLGQIHVDLELIVVDDGSTDDTAACVRAFDDARIRLVQVSPNGGVARARNRGLAETRAPFIAFLDADDECLPERLELQLSFLREHPDVDVVGSATSAIDEHGREFGLRTYPCQHDSIVRRLPLASPFATSTVMIRRDVLVAAGGFRPEWEPTEDYELWSRLALEGRRLANLPDPLVRYRLHGGACKSRALRRQLRMTLTVKAAYWKGRLGVLGLLRYAAEHMLLVAPPRLVLKLFVATAYRSGRR